MNIRSMVLQQYQGIADRAARQVTALSVPPEGWLRTMRKALGMSGAQLGRRMGLSRARIASAEHAELEGGITLRSMQATAEAMGCRFVYAVVPLETAEDLVRAQAERKATTLVGIASGHMALEAQALPDSRIAQEIERVTRDLMYRMPSDLWDDR